MRVIHSLHFIETLNTLALSHGKLATARTFCDSCDAQGTRKRDILYLLLIWLEPCFRILVGKSMFNRVLRRLWPSASTFKFLYLFFYRRSSSSWLHLIPRLLAPSFLQWCDLEGSSYARCDQSICGERWNIQTFILTAF